MSPILFKRSPIWSHWFAPFASSTFDDDIISSRVSNGAILQTYFRLSLWHCVDIMINFGCRLLWAMLKARSDNYEHYKEAKSFQNFTLLCLFLSPLHFRSRFRLVWKSLRGCQHLIFLSFIYYVLLDAGSSQCSKCPISTETNWAIFTTSMLYSWGPGLQTSLPFDIFKIQNMTSGCTYPYVSNEEDGALHHPSLDHSGRDGHHVTIRDAQDTLTNLWEVSVAKDSTFLCDFR